MMKNKINSPKWDRNRLKPLLILLDYDGTLTDFTHNPEHSRISAATRALLYRLNRKHPVIMVTGRYADSLIRVSGLKSIPIVGTHGFEARNLPGKLQFASPALQRRFKREAARLWKNIQVLRKRFPGVHIEQKPFSSTLHFRGINLSPSQVRNLQADFKALFRQTVTWNNWKIQGGKKMIEAMPKGFSKGKAVRKILEKYPGHFPLYAGDDIGDISVFRVLGKKGLRIAVGQRIPKIHSDLRFGKPADFIKWLGKLR